MLGYGTPGSESSKPEVKCSRNNGNDHLLRSDGGKATASAVSLSQTKSV